MAVAAVGGGSGAVGSSTHAACERFRGADPLITGRTRRTLAADLNFPDVGGGIPEARWMRAMTFERLVRDESFAGKIATTTVGQLDLERPTEVVIADASGAVGRTAELLVEAHARAVSRNAATVIHNLAVPFVGFEDLRATDVKPDFVVIARKGGHELEQSWLITGDAKDYERFRARIEDSRLLKGFLQVAVGAESFDAWSKLPSGMDVHRFGVLAVPRNSFLQPEAVVEDLADHRLEVGVRIAERIAQAKANPYSAGAPIEDFIAHLKATFDPANCTTCTLFGYCRNELEQSPNPEDLLIEIGVPVDVRPLVVEMVRGGSAAGRAPASVTGNVRATISAAGVRTGQRRIDPIGEPGTIEVVLAKSDAAALGVHGIALKRHGAAGASNWEYHHFVEPQSPKTRQQIMKLLGTEISAVMGEARRTDPDSPLPVHLVVPDKVTADVLVSIADNLAGVELSRLRWKRDKDEGRPLLTFDGEPATMPTKLSEVERTAVSFLLEEDRARAIALRSPVVDIREALARHIVAGGPAVNSGRLDYLVEWAGSNPIDHRTFGKEIENSPHTPGARLANSTSNAIHSALTGNRSKKGAIDLARYEALVAKELKYKATVMDRASAALFAIPVSNLRDAHRSLESDAQAIWRRRLSLHASDLVRFGRTYRWWRNSQVPTAEKSAKCQSQLLALANPQYVIDMAAAAGTRDVARATVIAVDPEIVLQIESRQIDSGSRIVLLLVNDTPCVESPDVEVQLDQKTSLKIGGLSIGPLQPMKPKVAPKSHLIWKPEKAPDLSVGDRVVVADYLWFGKLKGNRLLPVEKPDLDEISAPKPSCEASSYSENPRAHQYCCKSHEQNESDYSDLLASRRARGELNPEAWPPVRNADGFEVAPKGEPVGDPFDIVAESPPDEVTIDDLE